MAILGRKILKGFFKNGDKPNENNFWDWMDSFFHKTEDKIPITSVTNLAETLNSKANNIALHSETTERIESDRDLRNQIESLLESISEITPLTAIRGVTSNLWELQNMDTANFQDGDFYIINEGSNSIEFYLFNKGINQWVYHSSYQPITMTTPHTIVKTYQDLMASMDLQYGYLCMVISDETRNSRTACYQWIGSWRFIHEWIPEEGGGSGENLANTDLYQTDSNRTYHIDTGSLTFFNDNSYEPYSSSGLTLNYQSLSSYVKDDSGYCTANINGAGFSVSGGSTRLEMNDAVFYITNHTLDFYHDIDNFMVMYRNYESQKTWEWK
ncbi:MAG: hypothetical protein LIO93_08515 [Bacteroidales bacterium]|nr:hypothetical protein [Bacteroidales bacterium]